MPTGTQMKTRNRDTQVEEIWLRCSSFRLDIETIRITEEQVDKKFLRIENKLTGKMKQEIKKL